MDKISNECLEIVLYVGLKDEEVAVKYPQVLWWVRWIRLPPCFKVLTIDLVHDWCQQGTVSRLVFTHDQWRALIVGSPWREKRLRWQEPIVTIYDSTSNTASLHNCSPICVWLLLHLFSRHSVMFHNLSLLQTTSPFPPSTLYFFYPLSKTAKLKENNADRIW